MYKELKQHCVREPLGDQKQTKQWVTCMIETRDIADPVRDGGLDNLVFGFAKYAEGEADKTFRTWFRE